MYTILYGISLLISAAVLIYMGQKNYNNIDIYQWTIIVLIPVVIMAYWLKSRVVTPEAASALVCFTYLDSTFMITALLFALMHTIGVNVRSWVKIIVYGVAAVHLAIVGLCFNNGLYYRSIDVVDTGLGHATKISGGPLMAVHYAYLGAIALWLVGVLILALLRAGSYSNQNFFTYLILPIGAFVIYAVEAAASADYSNLPMFYAIADVIIALRYDRAHMHDIAFLIAEEHENRDTKGYLAVSYDGKFLCCNDESYRFVPFLSRQKVNEKLLEEDEAGRTINELITSFEEEGVTSAKYRNGNMTCVCTISCFSIRGNKAGRGYLLDISDGTQEQRAYDIIASYNETLNADVKEKTETISEMQHKIVLGMADMIENRDNNTGGHVKRTSDIISILVNEIKAQGKIELSDQFAEDIVRAAPTHDLGKVTIDSSILNKPGRFTDEEYAIMKTHSTKSGEMVMILLDGIEEDRFVKVAYNVARYHHERWDGRGYPEGLVGTMIPLEARIMAVADVYDALVSKRVYKDSMSFEKSAEIMCENMGTQFDPNMRSVFLGCREKLEDYYRQI